MNSKTVEKKDNGPRKGSNYIITATSLLLGLLLAMVGGFLDAYTYVTRNGVFANAQTGNVVLLGVKMAQGQWHQAFIHIPPILAFIIGVALAERMKHPKKPHNTARFVLLIECIILFVIGFIPVVVPNIIITSLIAFVASVQVAYFDKLDKWSYNNTVATGNLRTASQAAYLALFTHDKKEKVRFTRFLGIVLAFFTGALLGAYVVPCLGIKSVWIAAMSLLGAVFLFRNEDGAWEN
ncbi:DUF1275 domain-containing protein [Shimazuella sp. AN120528]|uniref:YoaK family protein n=1 Tax=Shimazuella soli TaxID=1892854 RepID=UPI001F10E18E|nr:YoaK family protein [Shimazuella soli]MCH5585575.1 DUF1275 domain-containing protein [Shimazuella soli]